MCAVTDVWFVCSNLSGFVYTLLHFFTEDFSHTKRGKNNSLHYEFCVYSNKCDTALTFSQHNKRARATQRQLSPVCLTDDLHYACTVWRNVRMKVGGGGSDLFFFQFCWSAGNTWWSHSRPVSPSPWRRRSEWTHPTPSRNYTEAAAAAPSNSWQFEICAIFTRRNKQRSARTIASSPFCNPVCTRSNSKRKLICGQFRMKWVYYKYKAKHQPPGWVKFSLVK